MHQESSNITALSVERLQLLGNFVSQTPISIMSRQYVAYAKLITSTNRRRSDGTHLDGRHGVSGRCSGSSWRCITKCNTMSWFDLTIFFTTVRVNKEEWVMLECSSKNRKSWNGRQMIWQCIPNIWSNRWKWFGSCHGGFTWRNLYWRRRRRAECSRRNISCKVSK